MNNYNAYHFFGSTLRDGTAVPADGVTLKHTGRVRICASGLHASYDPFDALKYAPGNNLARVYCTDIVTEHNDKFVCRERTIIQRIDATDLLCKFARLYSLSIADNIWYSPFLAVSVYFTAHYAARDAANSAATKEKQRERFNRMVNEAFDKLEKK